VALEDIARAQYAAQAATASRAQETTAALWAEIPEVALLSSWLRISDRMFVTVAAAQIAAAAAADPYVGAAATAQGASPTPEGTVAASAFAGVASDGRALDTLLLQPVLTALGFIARGASPLDAKRVGGSTLSTIVGTQVADAGRAAMSVATTSRPQLTGWVRMLTPPSCGRCAILAGRFYRWSSHFERHENCFPEGTVVSGPTAEAATRRWYEGELVIFRTARGKELSATGNHPVLTDRGWLPANLLQEGDHVVSASAGIEGAHALVVPDEHQMPARIEDLWRSGRMGSLRRVPTTAEDFHGDGGHGEVDVVLADGLLWHHNQAAVGQRFPEKHFAGGVVPALALLGQGTPAEMLVALANATDSGMRGGRLLASLFGRHFRRPRQASRGSAANRHASGHQARTDGDSGNIEPLFEGVFALAGLVGGNDLVPRSLDLGPRWDAPALPFSMENAAAYASRGSDLRQRLAGQIELDRVVELRRVQWSGHVYNLTSVEGWYNANGIIVSNCDCIHVPSVEDAADDLRTDPMAYFRSLPSAAELNVEHPDLTVKMRREAGLLSQEDAFTVAGAQAVRDGADIRQVVNARRGAWGLSAPGRLTVEEQKILKGGKDKAYLQRVDVFGRQVYITHEGTTRRGVAGKKLGAWSDDAVKSSGSDYLRAKTPRLMPEAVYELADGDRDEAIRLLRRFGYIA
jgi:hypothetical protein